MRLHFLIVEKKKEIKFDKKDFPKFEDKIVHIIINEDPVEKTHNQNKNSNLLRQNSIKRIETQRNYIGRALEDADKNDYVIYSDNDEIPDLSKMDFESNKAKVVIFKQKLFYYKFNLAYPKIDWFGSKSCKIKDLKNISWLRNIKNRKYDLFRLDTLFSNMKYIDLKIIEDGGWHFTNLKTPEQLYQKYINDEMHSEFENKEENIEDIKKKINQKYVNYNHFADSKSTIEKKYTNQFNLDKVSLDELPTYIKMNEEKYKDWID